MKLLIFPHIPNESDSPISGTLFELPSFCSKNKKKCQAHYSSSNIKKGFSQCPYGFTTYTTEEITYTGLKIIGYYNKNKVKEKCYNVFSPTLTKEQFLKVLNKEEDRLATLADKKKEIKAFESAMHEIRHLNADIKSRAEHISFYLNDKVKDEVLQGSVQDIFAQSSLISTRLNFFDYEVNPELVTQHTQPFEIYKKFDKVNRCFLSLCRNKSISMTLTGSCTYKTLGYQVIELLPFILIENAYKYSPKYGKIEIAFAETNEEVTVTVKSLGPKVENDELPRLCDLTMRGKYAEQHSTIGTGMGLYFAQQICQLHEYKLILSSSQVTLSQKNDIPFSNFTAILKIPKQNEI